MKWRALTIAFLLQGCFVSDLQLMDTSTDSGADDANADGQPPPACAPVSRADLLLMIDNSNSMDVEQGLFRREIASLARIITSGDRDGDGTQDFPPIEDLNIGVVSSDMGVGRNAISSCEGPEGDDGILRSNGNLSISGCMASYPTRFFNFRPERDGETQPFADIVGCVAALGTNGCGFEQQLESVLKAVTPRNSPIEFQTGSDRGHADVANAGFIRADSLLSVVMLTDEDDCSAADMDLYNMGSVTYPGSLNLRCWQYPQAVYPMERYVDGLLATRIERDLLVFAAIAGVPPSVEPRVGSPIDWDGILSHPDMMERQNPDEPQQLAPSCFTPGVGVAFPPRRLVEVARALESAGARSTVQSICNDSYESAVLAVVDKIVDALTARVAGCG